MKCFKGEIVFMKYKNFVLVSMLGIAVILFGVGVIVYNVDPYLQYHSSDRNVQCKLETNDFGAINPGISKNYEYDTIITGSSMSRAFLPSYIDEQFSCRTVKLSMAEARGKDYRDLFSVLNKNKKLKRVIMGIDTFAFTVDKDFTSYEKPLYLYDKYLINDMLYLVNMNGLVKSYESLKFTKSGGKTTSMDDYQNYAVDNTFEREKVIEIYKNSLPVQHTEEYDVAEQTKTIKDNLEKNIMPMIKNNPQIDFLFYIPPYSIVRWGITKNTKAEINAMQTIIEMMLPYENVSMYFCQGDTSVIVDLDNYMDTIHFSSEVANQIVDDMTYEKNKLTSDNYLEKLEMFQKFIEEYDYDLLIE